MTLRQRVADLEELVALLHFDSTWKDRAREWARNYGIPEDTMFDIWKSAVGPHPATSAEELTRLVYELRHYTSDESDDQSPA